MHDVAKRVPLAAPLKFQSKLREVPETLGGTYTMGAIIIVLVCCLTSSSCHQPYTRQMLIVMDRWKEAWTWARDLHSNSG